MRATAYAGTRAPYHSTACGKALLAKFDRDVRRQIYENAGLSAATEHTITDPERLEAGLAEVARRGYALEVEENELGAFCVARAISNSFDEALASISVASVTQRMSEEVVARFAAVLEEEVGKLELQLAGEGVGAITKQARAAGSRP